ncbi:MULTISPECIES: universal stress protein [Galbibacter]|uniref:Universal stress protein n=1 Tax=Galbibacter pacificus TaxID=2996052 RepID=A0ABT6FQZ2_9FLAO|nr:universal stress protein [Galbibacter pacificus]MDG3581979.1 universal stress protein [Galbibacter pacificus]MDG3585547.1 universal stress protein [Galbibacter pacificus]
MKKVLIAIDYNPTTEKVVEKGYELAKTLNAQVCLLHVISNLQYYGIQYPSFMGYDAMNVTFDPKFQDEMKKVAKDFLDTAQKHLNDNTVTSHISEGDTADEILNYAKEWGASLIVMGTHSHSTFEKLLIGTVASSVLEHTEIPVYMVPIKKD